MKKKSIYKISGILVLVVFMLGFVLTGCTAQNKTAGQAITTQAETTTAAETVAETTAVETQATEQLSEQPNKAKYDEYFSDFFLGKLARGQQAGPDNIPIKTAVFIASEDEFCVTGTVIKGITSFYVAVYDTVAKKDFAPKTVKVPEWSVPSSGDFGWSEDPIEYPAGKYEYKLYFDFEDAPVAVIPFEVR